MTRAAHTALEAHGDPVMRVAPASALGSHPCTLAPPACYGGGRRER
jgi:hypothetical protein